MDGYPGRPIPAQHAYNDFDPYSREGPPTRPRPDDPYSRGGGDYDPYSRRDDMPASSGGGGGGGAGGGRGSPAANVLFDADYNHGIDYAEFVQNIGHEEDIYARYGAQNGARDEPPYGGVRVVPSNGQPLGPPLGQPHGPPLGPPPGRNGHNDIYSRVQQQPPQKKNGYGAPDTSADGVYNLDHLATFSVGSKQGLMTPGDGIQKLRQMETTSGIWTMRVQLVMDRNDLLIIDKQTGEEMERFSYNLLTDITAVTNQERRDIYNNIILFSVQQDNYKRAPAEMHLFQVIGAPAQECVDDIKATIHGGGQLKQYRPPTRDAAQVQEQVRDYELAAQHAARATDAYRPAPTRPADAFRQSMRHPDTDQETVVSEHTDRDVQLLNHCFDDIEQFVGRLQHAAEAFKELDHRRRGRSDRRGTGDGMLTMRARPPPAKDFIDIFQKFKLSFNLLAKLKPHIHDPNAPELVHFLFTPLSLVVEASKDPRQGTPDLAAKVVAPLLTGDAKELLLNCLTSKEADLWVSLGDAWKLSREEWKGYVPPYYPRFSDGWTPSGGGFDEEYSSNRNGGDEPGGDAAGRGGRNNQHYRDSPATTRDREPDRRRSDDYDREAREREIRDREARDREAREREARERDAREREQRDRNKLGSSQASYLRELQTRGALAYEALHDRTAANEKELSLHKGDIVEVVDKRRNWWKLRNNRGQVGHAPYTILQLAQPDVRP